MANRLTVYDLLAQKGKSKWVQLHVDSPAEAAAAEAAGIRVISCEPDHNLEAVREAAPSAMISAGMPHGSVASADDCLRAGFAMLKRGADAVYCSHSPRFIEAMAREGIPVTGHVGLVPNLAAWTGFRAQGKTAEAALRVMQKVKDLENAGAAFCEVEVVPVELADVITRATPMVTMGMGCGSVCDTQYLFSSDVLGTHAGHYPRHSKTYADFIALEAELQRKRVEAFRSFARDVESGAYPEARHEVRMEAAAHTQFLKLAKKHGSEMMDDLLYGTRNKRGDWAPKDPAEIAPIWNMPPTPLKVLKWLPSYFLPYDVLWIASAFAWWYWILPDAETMKTLAWGWVIRLYVINLAAVFVFYGLFELRLYWLKAQGTRFKYNGLWPADKRSDVFWFKSQYIDSVLRIIFTALPIWTALEVGILYCFANGLVPWLTWAEHPAYLVGLALVMPIIHETHFYLIHRLIHTRFLYKWVHSVHHNSVNPSPLSSLNMHVVELVLYLGMACWHLIIPSNPILALYQLHRAGFGAIPGHIGFDRIEVSEDSGVATHAYLHYLHHKHFEVNYGDGLIPFDKWFGTFHDGSKQAQAQFEERYARIVAKANAKHGAV